MRCVFYTFFYTFDFWQIFGSHCVKQYHLALSLQPAEAEKISLEEQWMYHIIYTRDSGHLTV